MNREREIALWSRLRDAGIASGDTPARDAVPWYLAGLIGISAWIAAGFLVAFFFEVFDDLFDRGEFAVAVGAACCMVALGLLRIARGRDFVEQFAIAISLVGQVIAGIGVQDLLQDTLDDGHHRVAWAVIAAVALAMYALGRLPMHRFLCGLIVGAALAGVCMGGFDREVAMLAPVMLAWCAGLAWWAADRHRHAQALPPLAWALTLVAFVLVWLVDGLTGGGSVRRIDPFWQWAADLIAVPLLPVCVAWLSSRQTPPLAASRRGLAVALAGALALLWLRAPGVGVCASAALIGFALYRPALLATGCAALMLYLLHYYYQLGVPLLQKSYWLFGGGAALLLARYAYLRFVRAEDA